MVVSVFNVDRLSYVNKYKLIYIADSKTTAKESFSSQNILLKHNLTYLVPQVFSQLDDQQ